ncbi:MAG: 30S ribosomal protein S9 [bacterium]|nr:30S ribosomal protein S9 [bacterium]
MKNSINSTGKRKRAIAKAVLRPGTGKVKVNKRLLDVYEPKFARLKLMEPLIITGDRTKEFDVDVKVTGGGVVSQTDAARLAIAKAIVKFTKDKRLEKQFLEYDRHLLVADARRREERKPNSAGKARSKTQKSYR